MTERIEGLTDWEKKRNRSAIVAELRRLLPRMEGFGETRTLPFGVSAIDRHLPQGGLSLEALHEVVPIGGAVPAAFGFLVALLAAILPHPAGERSQTADGRNLPRAHPIFFVAMPGLGQYGRFYGHGLNALGFDPRRLVLIETRHRRDALWAMEEALHSRAPAAVAGVIDKLDLKASQRLHLAANECGLPLFLLRPGIFPFGAAEEEGSAAATRWRIGPVAAARDRFGLLARPRWHLTLERCRNGRPGAWTVEYDHVAHRFCLAATLADPEVSRRADKTNERVAVTRRRA